MFSGDNRLGIRGMDEKLSNITTDYLFIIEIDLIIVIALSGLLVAMLFEFLQPILKYRGYKLNTLASGYHGAMQIMVLNRFGAVVFFAFIALSIDRGVTGITLISSFMGALLIIAAIQLVILSLWIKQNDLSINFSVLHQKFFFLIAVVFSGYLGVLGLLIPWVVATYLYEIRLFVGQTGFVFNTIFTLINVFYIEKSLARSFDMRDEGVFNLVFVIIFGRILGVLMTIFTMLLWV